MNETLQKAVAVMIEKAISGIDTAANFLAAEIPDVIHQLLMWNLTYSFLKASLCFAIVVAIVYFAYHGEKKLHAEGDHGSKGLPTFVAAVLIVGPFCGLCSSVTEALKIWIAPKVWLIEYAAELVK